MKDHLDLQHPFFLPLWRRVVVVVLCLGWALFELSGGAMFWAALFGGIGIYAGYVFFFVFDEAAVREREEKK